jgi:hypothetical protein
MADRSIPRWIPWSLGALQIIIAVGAIAAGFGLITDPSGANLGFSVDLLADSPFDDYLIPGLALFVINGLGSLIGAFFTFRQRVPAGAIAMSLGAFLVAWIILQVYWIGLSSWLQPGIFFAGALEFLLGWLLRNQIRRRG